MLIKMSKQAASGQPVDLSSLGIGELIEDMNENEKIMEDLQTPWEEKLAAAKAKSGAREELEFAEEEEEKDFDHRMETVNND
jgi:hypothetical protein